MQRTAPLLLLVFALLLSGCGKPMTEVYTGQSEAEANEMLLVLRSHNLTAVKSTTKTGLAVLTPDAELAEAVRVLSAAGLPRQKRMSVTDLFPTGKMFTTPGEESIRSRFALEQQMASNLEMIQGVRNAHIILTLSEPVAHGAQTPSTASVMLIYDDRLDTDGLVSRVKLFVQNSVPKLPPDRISVVLFRAQYDTAAADAAANRLASK